MPGNTMIQRGSSLRYPAKMVAPLAWIMFLLARDLCTMTYNQSFGDEFHMVRIFMFFVFVTTDSIMYLSLVSK